MNIYGSLKKAVALTLGIIFIANPSMAFSDTATSINGASQQNTVSATTNNVPSQDLQAHCAGSNCAAPSENTSPLQAVQMDPHTAKLTELVSGLQNLLPSNYVASVRINEQGKPNLNITYMGEANSQDTKTLTLLDVRTELGADGKIKINLDTLYIRFKDERYAMNTGYAPVLKDAVSHLLETGFIPTPAIDSTTRSVAQNSTDLYVLLAMTQVRVTETSMVNITLPNTWVTPLKFNVTFIAAGEEYTASRSSPNPFVLVAKNPLRQNAIDYVSALQTIAGNNYKVMTTEKNTAGHFKVVMAPRNPVNELSQISHVEFFLNGGTIVAGSMKIYVVSGGQNNIFSETLLPELATNMLYSGTLQLPPNEGSTKHALARLLRTKVLAVNVGGLLANAVVTFKWEHLTYKLGYKGTSLIVSNITREAATLSYIDELRTAFRAVGNFSIEILSTDVDGRAKIRVTSNNTPIGASEFTSMDVTLFATGNTKLPMLIDFETFKVNFKGVSLNNEGSRRLFRVFGITIPSQTFPELSSIVDIKDKLVALTQIKMGGFEPSTGRVSFTYKNQDYRVAFRSDDSVISENLTYLRALTAYLASLRTIFPGMKASFSEAKNVDGTYAIRLTDASPSKGGLSEIKYNVKIDGLNVMPDPKSLLMSFNCDTGYGIGGQRLYAEIQKISAKSDFYETLLALRATKMTSFISGVYRFTYAKKEYWIETLPRPPVSTWPDGREFVTYR